MTEIPPEEFERLGKLRTFCVNVYYDVFGASRKPWPRLPPHRLVIEPIVAKARAMRIYGHNPDSLVLEHILALGAQRRGYIEVDLSREVVRGFECVWSITAWERGSIVVAARLGDEELGEILSWCDEPCVWASRHQIRKANPASAIRYADSVAAEGLTAFLFPASNGIEWMDIFPPAEDLARYYGIALERCRPFVKFENRHPGEDEIIVDRPPYTEMV